MKILSSSQDRFLILDKLFLIGFCFFLSSFATAGKIHAAAKKGSKEKITFLLKEGVNIDSQDENNNTALHYASFHGYWQIIGFLIQKGASVNIKNSDGDTPLHLTVTQRYSALATSDFLKGNVDVNTNTISGKTALRLEQLSNNLLLVATFLTQKGADMHLKNDKAKTPFSIAKTNKDKQLLILFKSQKVMNLTDKTYKTFYIKKQNSSKCREVFY